MALVVCVYDVLDTLLLRFLKIHTIIFPSSELSLHFIGFFLKVTCILTLIYIYVVACKQGVAAPLTHL